MKKFISVNYKLVFILGSILLLILGAGLIGNKLFFYDYYLNYEKHSMLHFAEELDEHYNGDLNVTDEIEKYILQKKANVMIISMNNEENWIYNSYGSKNMQREFQIPDDVIKNTYESDYEYFTLKHQRFTTDLQGLAYKLNSGDILLVSIPIEELINTANIAIGFNIKITTGLLFIGIIVMYFLSKRITKPIIKLSSITEKISKLDFSEKFIPNKNDEIMILGENINSMSKSLEKSLLELKNANDQLLEDIREKDKLVEVRKEFIGNISHELKTPIALIMGYTEGLKENIATEKKDYYLDVITKESKHMDELVRDLLNLTEIEYDAFKLNINKFDMSSLIDEILDRYYMMIKDKQLKIKLEKADIVIISADKKRIEMVLSNLLINAIEHIEEAGELVIEIIESEEKIRVEVKNTGSKIPDESLENIWTSFYKLKNTEKRIGGSGIGLSIVRAVIEKHNGEYGVYNTYNGVSFWFELNKKM